jgi:hypothetical protein
METIKKELSKCSPIDEVRASILIALAIDQQKSVPQVSQYLVFALDALDRINEEKIHFIKSEYSRRDKESRSPDLQSDDEENFVWGVVVDDTDPGRCCNTLEHQFVSSSDTGNNPSSTVSLLNLPTNDETKVIAETVSKPVDTNPMEPTV